MKTTMNILAAATIFAATAFFSLSAESGLAEPPHTSAVSGDAYTGVSPRGSEKQDQERTAEAEQLDHDAAIDLHAGRYAQAETEARRSLSLQVDGVSDEVLASSLETQGKDAEALEQYRVMVVDQKAGYVRVLLPYAQLLLKSGQWAQALAVYNQALPSLPDVGPHPETPIVHDGDLMTASSHFSADVPEPAALATALHIARGMVYNDTPSWSGDSQNTEAMTEYMKALQLAPDNALANYFYGVGWQRLSPTDRAKFGTAQQAKAHLQKAVKVGKGSVKAAAEKALKAIG